ncbi:MAG: DNA translocase FtsK 4TM domain-containing protein [Eggerthellaceae bacterium]|nr:DNA translocase FtsK 4TM domain-containing protein [Eggerthellaceae bacterium]
MARKTNAASNRTKSSSTRKRAASPAEKSARRKAGTEQRPDQDDRIFDERTRRDIAGVAFIVVGIVLMIAAVMPVDAVVTSFLSRTLHLTLGLGAYLFPLFLVACGVTFLVRFDRERVPMRFAIGFALIFIALLTLLALTMPVDTDGGAPNRLFDPAQLSMRGGYIGAGIAWAGYTLFGQAISIIIMLGLIVIGLVIIGFSFSGIIQKARDARRQRTEEERRLENVVPAPAYEQVDASGAYVPLAAGSDGTGWAARKKRRAASVDHSAKTRTLGGGEESAQTHRIEPADLSDAQPQTLTRKLGRKRQSTQKAVPLAKSPAEKKRKPEKSEEASLAQRTAQDGFVLPSMDLLRSTDPSQRAMKNDEELGETAACLQETLEDFKIMAKVVGWVAGPTVTLFKVDLPAGVRVSRVTALEADIALALAAPGVRIFAPIPGTNYVGIEVPNRTRRTVYLGDVLQDATGGPLEIAIGEDVEGHHIVTDLAKMPHLLIGGTTGSGKSVSINAMIMSILMRATPSEVRFIMIDPKRVEFTPYNGIPHLYVPVVTEAKEAASALAWGVAEMERRLKVFSKAGARNIGQYNDLCEQEAAKIEAAKEVGEEPPEAVYGDKLPYIVIIIDELADLMMNVGKEVEFSISRIAQLARAAGIHLIVATQRPSTNVVTGLIKANITNRIAFNVASGIDSRVILDTPGAERLIGLGDLLFSKPEYAKPQRMQGCFVSNEEISAVVDALKQQGEPEYHSEILKTNLMSLGDTQPDGSGGSVTDDDPLIWEAADIVVSSGLGSTSNIQRRLKVGYSRAGRIMDMLEAKGVVGPPNGSKPREVLVDQLELETLKAFEANDASEE